MHRRGLRWGRRRGRRRRATAAWNRRVRPTPPARCPAPSPIGRRGRRRFGAGRRLAATRQQHGRDEKGTAAENGRRHGGVSRVLGGETPPLPSSFPSSAWERTSAKLRFASRSGAGREAELRGRRSQAELGNEGGRGRARAEEADCKPAPRYGPGLQGPTAIDGSPRAAARSATAWRRPRTGRRGSCRGPSAAFAARRGSQGVHARVRLIEQFTDLFQALFQVRQHFLAVHLGPVLGVLQTRQPPPLPG